MLCCWDETFFVLPGGERGGDGSVRRKYTARFYEEHREMEMNTSSDIEKLSRGSCMYMNLDSCK